MFHFKPLQPRIICVNDTPKEWLRAIEGVKDTDKLPLEKRVLFVHVDELVISPEAVAAYEADLDDIVKAGKRRRLEHYSEYSAMDIEVSSTVLNEEPSTSAGSSSISGKSDSDSIGALESLWSSDESSDDEGGVAPTRTADGTDHIERSCLHCKRTLPRSRKGAVCKSCKLCPPGGNKGWRRDQGRIDFLAVQNIVREACAGNKWVKKEQTEHVSDFIAHLVAASYAKPSNAGRTPEGYDFLPVGGHEFPHPNGDTRKRTIIAKEIVDTLGPDVQHQIFGIVLWRYHNTVEAWTHMRLLLLKFCESGDMEALRQGVAAMYHAEGPTKAQSKSHLFSGRRENKDAIRCSGAHGSWRKAVVNSLEAWWRAAQHAAEILSDPATTPAIWHQRFLREIMKAIPSFGPYWCKYIYGDIGQHIAPAIVDLENYTMVGNGSEDYLRMMGLKFRDAQQEGLEIVRELRDVVNKVVESGLHNGLQKGREEMRLRPLTAYDLQVQCCECKKGLKKQAAAR